MILYLKTPFYYEGLIARK